MKIWIIKCGRIKRSGGGRSIVTESNNLFCRDADCRNAEFGGSHAWNHDETKQEVVKRVRAACSEPCRIRSTTRFRERHFIVMLHCRAAPRNTGIWIQNIRETMR